VIEAKVSARRRYVGVVDTRNGKFGARIRNRGEYLWLGTYSTERDAAEHDDAGNVAWCPAFDAAHEVALKVGNYLSKRGQVKGAPAAYVVGCIRRAAADPTDLMGRTRAESKAAYREMCALNHNGAAERAELQRKYTPTKVDAAQADPSARDRAKVDPEEAERDAAAARARFDRLTSMTPEQVAAEYEAGR
jgi:hypothetical protein